MHLLRGLLLGVCFVLVTVLSGTSSALAADQTTSTLVVKLVSGLSLQQQTAVIARDGGRESSSVPALRLHVITVPSAELAQVLQTYQSDPQVERVELEKSRKADGIPGDLDYGVQWALPKIGYDLVFGTATPAGSARVALLDTGVDASHPDLAGNVLPGTSLLDGSNGLSDPNGHGTALAGIVAAVTDNGRGMAGVAYRGVQIVPVTVLDATATGQDSNIIAGIIWAADHGADVIVMGFSNTDFSSGLQEAIDYAWSKGVVLVAAAGNSGVGTPTFPAGNRGVIGVAASDPGDLHPSFSNFGQSVFLAAPGSDIYTTDLNGSYSYISGTSASSAIVGGVAAFLKAADPTLSNGVIAGRLGKSAAAIGTPEDPNNQAYFGNGRVDLAAALASDYSDFIQPSGAAPVGSGGPYIGPYTAAAGGGGSGTFTVTPSSVPYGSTGSYQFTFNAGAGTGANNYPANSYLLFSVPAAWPAPTLGNIAVTGTCTVSIPATGAITGSGPWTVRVDMACGNNETFTVTYSPGSTAPASTTAYTFSTSTYRGGSLNQNGNQTPPVALAASPTILVSKADQTVSAITFAPASVSVGGTATASATATSALGVSFSSTTPSVCSVSGSTVTALSAGTCTIAADQGGDNNYNPAPQVTSQLTVSKISQSIGAITLSPATLSVGTSSTAAATASSGLPVSFSTSTPAVCSVRGSTVTALSAGACSVTAEQGGDESYGAAAPVTQNVTVGKGEQAALTVTGLPGSATYGQTGIVAGVSGGSGTGAVSFSSGSSTACSVNSSSGAVVITRGSGTCSITATKAGDANYNAVTSQGAAISSITPATLTVTAANASKVYGTPNPTFSVSYSGFVNGDGAGSLAAQPSASSSATVASPVAGYAITPSGGVSSNYSFNYVNGTLTVTPAPLTITADSKSKSYGSANPPLTYTPSGFVNGDTATVLSGAPALSTTALDGSAAGSYPIAVSGGNLAAANYSFVYVNGTLTVARAQLTVSAESKSKVYGSGLPSLSYTVSGFVNGDTAAAVSGSPTLSTTATSASPVGSYPITAAAGTLAATNYNFSFANGTLTVTPAVLTITANNAAKTYGSPNPLLSYTPNGFVNGDTAAVLSGAPALATTATSASPAGNYAISAAPGTLAAANYTFTFVSGTLTVNRALLTITANDAGRSYGAANPTFGYTPSGFVNGDSATVLSGAPALSTTATTGSAVGSYPISAAPGSLAAANYDFSFVSGTLTVTPAVLTITANNASKSYGAAIPPLGYTPSGFVNGDNASVLSGAPALSTAATAASPIGSYPISAAAGDLSAANYTFSYLSGTLTVTPAPLTITANDATRSYGAANPAFTVSYAGFVNGDDAASLAAQPLLACSATASSPVGSYAIVPSGASGSNYSISYRNGSLSVQPVALTVVAAPKSKSFGQADPELTYSASGFASGDGYSVLTGSLARTAGESVGVYAITQGSLSAGGNYAISFTGANLTITTATLTVTAHPQSKVYGQGDPVLGYSVSGFAYGDSGSMMTGALARTAGEAVGSYAITRGDLSAGTNYSISFTGANLAITPASLSVTADPQSKLYGDSDPAFTYAVSGFVGSDTSALLTGNLTRRAGEGAGSYAITQGSLSAGPNYAISYTGAELRINRAILIVTANAVSKSFGQADPPLGYSLSGLTNGDGTGVLSGALARTAGENAGSYPITQGSLSAGANYAIAFTGANLTITPAAQTITFAPLPDQSFGDGPITLNASSSSALPVSFSSSTPAVCTVSDTTLTITGVGTCAVVASQGGSPNFFAAAPVSQSFSVTAGALHHFAVSTDGSSQTAGAAFGVTITAQDAGNNTVSSFSGSVALSTTAGSITPALSGAFVNGVWSGSVAVTKAGPAQSIGAADAASGKSGVSPAFAVNAAAPQAFSVSAPTSAAAGSAFSVTVTAKDAYDNRVLSYLGTVRFSSSDRHAGITLPADYTFLPEDNGSRSFTSAFVLETAGSQTVSATDAANAAITGTSNSIAVDPAGAAKLLVTAPPVTTAGAPFDLAVTVMDSYDNVITGYTGTIRFTSSDLRGVLPVDYTFLPADAGSHLFTGVATLTSGGAQTVTAADTATAQVAGTSGSIMVGAAAANALAIADVPAATTAGMPITPPVLVRVVDRYGNTVTGSTAAVTVSLGSNPAGGTLAGQATVHAQGGIATFGDLSIDVAAGGYTLNASSDDLQGAVSNAFAITLGGLDHFVISPVGDQSSTTPFAITVTAKDAAGNTVSGFSGSVDLSVSGGLSITAAEPVLLNGGVWSGNVTVTGSGVTAITATKSGGVESGSSNQFNVSRGGQIITVVQAAPANAVYNTAFQVSATASSALPVAISASGSCSGSGLGSATVTMTSGSGTCTVSYDQGGDGSYNAAAQVTDSVAARKATPTVESWPTATAISYGESLERSALTGGSASVAGSFAFTTPGATPAAGAATQSVTFTPSAVADYLPVTGSVSVAVNRATPTVTAWPTASPIGYGQTLAASTLSGGSASVAGGFSFTTSGIAPSAGAAPQSVTFTPSDTANYNSVTGSVSVTVNKATPAVTSWPSASRITYGDTLDKSNLSGGEASVPGSFSFSAPGTVPNAGTAQQDVTFTPSDSVNYATVSGKVAVTVTQAQPKVNAWPKAASITYGQPLSAATLSGGSAAVQGLFRFTSPSSTPSAGTSEQDVTFSPNDNNYAPLASTITVTVNQATPTVTAWPSASSITYGQTLASSTLSGGSAGVPGRFAFTTPGTAPSAGTSQQGVTFTPDDSANYTATTGTVSVTVNRATPTVTAWPTAAPISYGDTLEKSVLSGGSASVPGRFAFTVPQTAPSAGTAQQSVTFTPDDTADYLTVSAGVSVTVQQATPTVSAWPTASAITYGQTLASSTLSGGGASVAGSFAFTTPGAAPNAGSAQQGVTFTPTDSNYARVTGSVGVTVDQAAPTVTAWPTASAITFGEPLSAASLSGGSSPVPGSFSFTTPGATPNAGAAPQSVTFTPSDGNYHAITGAVSVTVRQATPSVSSWPSASAITYGETLAASALSGGSASVAGGFGFTTPAAKPNAGRALQGVTFTPSDSNYAAVTGSVFVTVNQATPTVSAWPVAGAIHYGETLASSFLSGGSASVPGAFAFKLPATAPATGAAAQEVVFTPADTGNYLAVSGSVSVTVIPATPTVSSWPAASAITYGETLASSTLSGGTASVPGAFAFSAAATAPNAGSAPQSVVFTPTDTVNYTTVTGSVTVLVNQARPAVSAWPTATPISYGQTLAASTLSGGSASVPGGFSFTSAGTIPSAGTAQQSVTFTPASGNYSTVIGSVSVTVNQARPTITAWPTAGRITYGQTLSAAVLTGGSSSVPGRFVFTAPSAAPGAGTAEQGVTFIPNDATNYTGVAGTVTLTVDQATPQILRWPSASTLDYGQTLAASTLSGGSSAVPGEFRFASPSTAPVAGTTMQSVTFTPSDSVNFTTATGAVSVRVNQATPTVTAWPTASPISYGQTLSLSTLTGGSASVPGSFSFTTPGTGPGAGTAAQFVTFTPTDASNYRTVGGSVQVTVNKANPAVTAWPNASPIASGSTLKSSILSGGTASQAGSFAFTAPATVPPVGVVPVNVTFTPADSSNYNALTGTVNITVLVVGQGTAIVTTGSNVAVAPTANLQLLFSSVSSVGTVVALPAAGSGAPVNYKPLSGANFDTSSTASFSGPITVCMSYSLTALTNQTNEPNLKLFSYNGSQWQDITTIVDSGAGKVCGATSALAQFMVSEPINVCAAPPYLTVPATSSTGNIYPRWGGSNVAGASYVLEYSKNGGPWTPAYSGIYMTASLPTLGNGTYAFRVKATRTGYADSSYTYSTTCTVTLACAAPGTITVPETSSTGNLKVSWGGTDAAGATYYLEYSRDGGSWTQAYSGSYGSASVSVPNGSYVFRVHAEKAGYITSGYTISGSCNVSLACAAPALVTVPTASASGSVNVSWGGSNVSGAIYYVEYSKNGGPWTLAYHGSYLSTGVTVSNGTYVFRVHAEKNGYLNSGYTFSGSCLVTLACTAPGSVTIPSSSTTLSIPVRWGGSSVAEVTYEVERSSDGGNTWQAAWSGMSTSAVVTVPLKGSYKFRVRAVKEGYLPSAYVASGGACSVLQ